MSDFAITAKQIPSAQLIRSATAVHVEPAKIMRDYYALREASGVIRIVVGDMANNVIGAAVTLPELATWAGLPPDMQLNGGLAGSLACKRQLIESHATGAELIKTAHTTLADTYRACGWQHIQDPAERFTGYVTHVEISPQRVTLTAVGDVFAWINGTLVAGAEKQVDTEKAALIDALLADSATSTVQATVEQFVRAARLDSTTAAVLRKQIIALTKVPSPPSHQSVYDIVDSIITPWHIRHLQNKPAGTHPWAYGAIDGTETPAEFIQTVRFPTAELQTLVIATDGSAPLQADAAVQAIGDLQAVNSEFSEQTIVAICRNSGV